jgi:hypothetical protein
VPGGWPRWLAHLIVVVGWLLTPVVAGGASSFGVWLGSVVGIRFQTPGAMVLPVVIGMLLFGFGALWVWVRLMRRLPHLLSHRMAVRKSLEIQSEQIPG